MKIENYTSCFHDGSIFNIKQFGDTVEIWMESSEILPEWKVDIPLSNVNTIRGKLIVTCIKNIMIDNLPIPILEKKLEEGEILRFRINNKLIDLMIVWWDNSQNHTLKLFEHVSILADNIEWENIPCS